jgi:precorrin-3B synthase
VLRPHRAADGALLRLRIPGGAVSARALAIIGGAAVAHADGVVQLTSRANLQLRCVATDERGGVSGALVDEVERAGLLPHPSHDRVRNIVCSPLTGLRGGLADLRPLVHELDERLCATPELARLPGPFLFTLDDGRGDVCSLGGDLGLQATDAGTVRIRVADLVLGESVPVGDAVTVLLELATAFQRFGSGLGDSHPPIWHTRELPAGGRELLPETRFTAPVSATPPATTPPLRYGRLAQDDGRSTVSSLVPLGLLAAPQVRALVAAAEPGSGTLVITPWRGVLVPDLPPDLAGDLAHTLAEAGLENDDASPWRGITACTGAPQCAQGVGQTRPLARSIARFRGARPDPADSGLPVHVVGCGRRCGSPDVEHIEVLSLGDRAEIRSGGDPWTLEPADVPAAVAAVAPVARTFR